MKRSIPSAGAKTWRCDRPGPAAPNHRLTAGLGLWVNETRSVQEVAER